MFYSDFRHFYQRQATLVRDVASMTGSARAARQPGGMVEGASLSAGRGIDRASRALAVKRGARVPLCHDFRDVFAL